MLFFIPTLCMGVIYVVLQRRIIFIKSKSFRKKCVRIITFSDFNSHTNPLFIQLKIIKLRDVIKLQQLKLVYEFTNKIVPMDLMSFFSYRHEAHTTNLELKSDQMNMLSAPNIRTVTYGNKSIKYHCARLWNSFLNNVVPTDANFDNNLILDNIRNIYLFKSKLKKHFLYLYTLD